VSAIGDPGRRKGPEVSCAPGSRLTNLGPNTDSGSSDAIAVSGTRTPSFMVRVTLARPSGSSSISLTRPTCMPRTVTGEVVPRPCPARPNSAVNFGPSAAKGL
jgi:hypothetical protein